MQRIAALRQKRGQIYDQATALLDGTESLTGDVETRLKSLYGEIDALDAQIKTLAEHQAKAAATAQPVADQTAPLADKAYARPNSPDKYEEEPSLVIGGCTRMLARCGSLFESRREAASLYGESHPVTKALIAGSGPAGGFLVPPDYMPVIIELLRARAVVRAAAPRTWPMPRGTMTIPRQSGAAVASYGSEFSAIAASKPALQQIIATYKKLTALVGIGNDLMRFADPATDAFVRDDLVKVIGLREDLAFLTGDGTQGGPMGFLAFANRWVGLQGGTIGAWNSAAVSTLAVNASPDPANTTGGNFITSNPTYTLATVQAELAGAVNRLDTANVPDSRRRWFMHPRIYNYLYNVTNSLGLYVFRDELMKATLLGYPFSKTTQMPTNIWDATGTNKDLSFVFLVEMDEALLLDAMQLELVVSRDGTYLDETGTLVNAFQQDQSIIRAIEEHDFQMFHDQSISVIQGVRWAPAIQ